MKRGIMGHWKDRAPSSRLHVRFIFRVYAGLCRLPLTRGCSGMEVLGMHVLLVEDERTLSTYIKRGLEEHGYAVDVAYTGREALDWLQGGPFDLIVLDIMLPQLDGLSLCRTMRECGVQTPVLMLTARDTVDDRVTGLDAGADDYLVKPFAIEELLARLRAITRRAADQPKQPV